MSTKTAAKTSRDFAAEVAFLTRALKAPTLRESVARLAERARAESWTHEEYLVACLQREVSARESHGGEGRIRAARFPARKSLELSGVDLIGSFVCAGRYVADASVTWLSVLDSVLLQNTA